MLRSSGIFLFRRMVFRLSKLKIVAITLLSVCLAIVLFVWLALPGILQSQAERYIAEHSRHRLSMAKPELHLSDWSLKLKDVRLLEPDGKPLLAVRELLVDLSASSVTRRAMVFDAIQIDGLDVRVAIRKDGRLNWSALIDALSDKEKKPDEGLPRLDIDHLVLAGGRLDFADEKRDFSTRADALDLELRDISTFPNEKGQYKLSAKTSLGARIAWQGQASIAPLAMSGHVALQGLELKQLHAVLAKLLPVTPAAGVFGVEADYQAAYDKTQFSLRFDKALASVQGLRIEADKPGMPTIAIGTLEAKGGQFDVTGRKLNLASLSLSQSEVALPRGGADPMHLLLLDNATVEGTQVDLAAQQVKLDRIGLRGGKLHAARDAKGRIDVVEALRSTAAPRSGQADAGPGWNVALAKLDFNDFVADLRDGTVSPEANLLLDDIDLSLEDISSKLEGALPVRLSVRAKSGGVISMSGKITPSTPAADLQFKLEGLNLAPLQPYLSSVARLQLASGVLSSDGRVVHNARASGFRGGFAVRNLKLLDADSKDTVIAFNSLGTRSLDVSTKGMAIGELAIEGLDTSLVIGKDRSVNISRIFQRKAPAAGPAAPAGPVYPVAIERVRLIDGELDFADYSLALPFGTRIHKLNGNLNGLSTKQRSPGQVELDGQVDEYGVARAVGQIDLLDPANFMDLKVVFRNVEMTRLTPYSATFAGRRIDSGKLSLDLEYKVQQRKLVGENQVVMDKLVLGSRMESASAKDLPLDLAIALLEDADGRIDLGLPVSGSLDDPEFSYGSLVWKALSNVIGKLVTAPFRALGSLFGGKETFENILFENGEADLSPPEREKLVRLVGMLQKRPGLMLTLHGVYAESDRRAMRENQLRRAIALKAGQTLAPGEDPGPLSTRAPKTQQAIEALYGERMGGAALTSLQGAYRQANPEQAESSTAGKMMSRLSGLFNPQKPLSAQALAELKGVDLHALMFQRLLDKEVVSDDQLRQLGQARGAKVVGALQAAGASADRIAAGAPETIDADARELQLKLVLSAAARK